MRYLFLLCPAFLARPGHPIAVKRRASWHQKRLKAGAPAAPAFSNKEKLPAKQEAEQTQRSFAAGNIRLRDVLEQG